MSDKKKKPQEDNTAASNNDVTDVIEQGTDEQSVEESTEQADPKENGIKRNTGNIRSF